MAGRHEHRNCLHAPAATPQHASGRVPGASFHGQKPAQTPGVPRAPPRNEDRPDGTDDRGGPPTPDAVGTTGSVSSADWNPSATTACRTPCHSGIFCVWRVAERRAIGSRFHQPRRVPFGRVRRPRDDKERRGHHVQSDRPTGSEAVVAAATDRRQACRCSGHSGDARDGQAPARATRCRPQTCRRPKARDGSAGRSAGTRRCPGQGCARAISRAGSGASCCPSRRERSR